MPENLFETALVILVPEADPFIQSLHIKYESSDKEGIPAHITINYPFRPDIDGREDLHQQLSVVFSSIKSFDFSLFEIGRFPGVIYLKPEPEDPFRYLIQRTADEFPESPPYGGVFGDHIPHLTIAHNEFFKDFTKTEQEIEQKVREILPILSSATKVSLIDNQSGRWEERYSFKLRTPNTN